jgi:hypothetical protein
MAKEVTEEGENKPKKKNFAFIRTKINIANFTLSYKFQTYDRIKSKFTGFLRIISSNKKYTPLTK